jgi:hypothetical protein
VEELFLPVYTALVRQPTAAKRLQNTFARHRHRHRHHHHHHHHIIHISFSLIAQALQRQFRLLTAVCVLLSTPVL